MKNKLEIRDLNQASLLFARDYNFEKVEWKRNIAYFIFEDEDESAEELIRDYLNGQVIGNIKKFADAQRTLKNVLFSSKK